MDKMGRSEDLNYWPDAGVLEFDHVLECSPSGRTGARLISTVIRSHGKHFIVMSHSNHVTITWAGRAATLPTLKGGRTHGRNKLLTGKMREDHAF
jgi:hypothetical protein